MHKEDSYGKLIWVCAAVPQQRGLSKEADAGF